jgi:hypothetical protein
MARWWFEGKEAMKSKQQQQTIIIIIIIGENMFK